MVGKFTDSETPSQRGELHRETENQIGQRGELWLGQKVDVDQRKRRKDDAGKGLIASNFWGCNNNSS